MASGVQVIRSGNARAKMDQVLRRYGNCTEKGLIAAANVLMDESLKLVPRDSEALADSASITQVGSRLLTIVYVGYGLRNRLGQVIRGPGQTNFVQHRTDRNNKNVWKVPANYAWIQHFKRRLQHPHGGQADYLGEPSRTKIPQMRAAFNQAFRVEAP